MKILRPPSRAGMTLVEMLVAITATLLLMAAVAQMFSAFGTAISGSRALLDLDAQMRTAAWRLRSDLEIIEGPESDEIGFYGAGQILRKSLPDAAVAPYEAATGSDDRLVGDVDDLLLFTIRGDERDFRGKLGPVGIRSPYAEVIWYCTPSPNASNPRTFTLHRRQRIVQSHPGAGEFVAENRLRFVSWADLYRYTDVSCRLESGYAYPNSLGDLAKRENRFLRETAFPYRFDGAALTALLADEFGGERFGDDAILTNVIGFDVRVYDAGAPVQVHGPPYKPLPAVVVTPGDPGYIGPLAAIPPGVTIPSWGAYVDLGYGIDPVDGEVRLPHGVGASPPLFHGKGDPRSKMVGGRTEARAFCTWSSHYESNAVDEDGRWGPEQGVNGVDDDANELVDDPPEAETAPPYPLALRGIEVRVRCYEPASRTVRQVTIRQNFN